ncbi:MAG: hypothetical protein H6Q92_1681 [Nitrospirae bacterium]|nr:hypothetical protein [Nitrospirota bacterium]
MVNEWKSNFVRITDSFLWKTLQLNWGPEALSSYFSIKLVISRGFLPRGLLVEKEDITAYDKYIITWFFL